MVRHGFWGLYENFGDWRGRRAFTKHFMKATIGLSADQFRFVLDFIQIIGIPTKQKLVEELEFYNVNSQRHPDLQRKMGRAAIPKLGPIIKLIKTKLSEIPA